MPAGEHDTFGPVIEARGVTKKYGGALALDDVDFELRRGEIHALLGENGAGKSTLIKILAGVVTRDAGEIDVDGVSLPHRFGGVEVARAGLAFVHQDLGLVEQLSIAENIALATGYATRGRLISFAATERRAQRLLEALGLELSPRQLVGRLDQDARVMVAVARAFALDAKAIVLDEVSSSLPAPKVARLAEALRASRAAGVSYIYVTHRLEELAGFADRVTVLRDGRTVATADLVDVTRAQLVEWILGAATTPESESAVAQQAPSSEPRLVVRGLRGQVLAGPLDFSIRRGEILGVCGLVGSGTRELAAMIGGGAPPVAGTAELDGGRLPLGSARAIRLAGCGYIPGNRQAEGTVASMSVLENLFLCRLRKTEPIWRGTRAERDEGAALSARFQVRPADALDKPLAALSGGNQQKVVAARALHPSPPLLVADDPTAGVDVGSRAELHRLLREHAATGACVLLVSTDFEEVAAVADRAIVLASGHKVDELSGTDLTVDRLARASYAEVTTAGSTGASGSPGNPGTPGKEAAS